MSERLFTAEQFWARVQRTDESCWFWTGAHGVGGYGVFTVYFGHATKRKGLVAHRMAWELLVGPIPENMELDHLCRNRSCVRPAHMELVTPAQNKQRAAKENRRPVPVDSWAAEVRAALDVLGLTQGELARALGVREHAVSRWVNGHVQQPYRDVRDRLEALLAETGQVAA